MFAVYGLAFPEKMVCSNRLMGTTEVVSVPDVIFLRLMPADFPFRNDGCPALDMGRTASGLSVAKVIEVIDSKGIRLLFDGSAHRTLPNW